MVGELRIVVGFIPVASRAVWNSPNGPAVVLARVAVLLNRAFSS
jgi:hypothetical protein